MVWLRVNTDEQEEKLREVLNNIPGWDKYYAVRRGDSVGLSNIVNGKPTVWFEGFDAVMSLVTVGYVAVSKFCPYIKEKCRKTECAMYLIQNRVGDCAHLWAGIRG